MAAAALTPRVRILVICDTVLPSETEQGVFTLEGVRQDVFAGVLPYHRDLSLFLFLTSPRHGKYEGWVRVIHNDSTRTIRYSPFHATFEQNHEWQSLFVELGNCKFPQVGAYTFEVWFRAKNGEDAQKGEMPFLVLENEG
jgi:hypothetical protein